MLVIDPKIKSWIIGHQKNRESRRVYVGLTVLYILTGEDQDKVERLTRSDFDEFSTAPMAGEIYPLVVTNVWSGTHINGRVFPDGNITLPVFSVPFGFKEGNWFFLDTRL